MTEKYILAIDQGTTSSRAILFDHQMRIVSEAFKAFKQYYPSPGWVEHDADEIWSGVEEVMKSAVKKARIKTHQIAAIGITNQRETTLIWDKKTSKPLHRAIVWQSRQSAEICEKWQNAGFEPMVKEKTGLLIDAYFSASKVSWLLQHVKGLRKKAQAGEAIFGTMDTWLLWKLTAGKSHATDASNASRTMFCNISNGRWDEELLKLFDIPAEILPEIKDSSGLFGVCEGGPFDGIPIYGMAGDQQAALFGQCCFQKGMAKNTYGTGCFMLMNVGEKRVKAEQGLLSTIAWQRAGKISYALEGSVFVAGAAIQWLRDELGILRNSADSEKIALQIKSNEGVYFIPAFVGLGSPHWQSDARGTITGITRGTGKAHLIRAALEAMAYQSFDVFDLMQKIANQKLKTLRIDGGASVNNFIAQFQADLLNCKVERPLIKETTALGAAMLAGLGIGFWKDENELMKSWEIDQVYIPTKNRKRVNGFLEGWQQAVNACIAATKNCD